MEVLLPLARKRALLQFRQDLSQGRIAKVVKKQVRLIDPLGYNPMAPPP